MRVKPVKLQDSRIMLHVTPCDSMLVLWWKHYEHPPSLDLRMPNMRLNKLGVSWSRRIRNTRNFMEFQIALVSSLARSESGVSKTLTILFSTCSLVTAPALDRLVVAMRHFWVALRQWRTKLQSILHNWFQSVAKNWQKRNDDHLGFDPRLSCAASSCTICSPTLPSAHLSESPAKLQHLKQEQELESPAAKQQRSNHFGVWSFGQVNCGISYTGYTQ
jgi:hypothetical protein